MLRRKRRQSADWLTRAWPAFKPDGTHRAAAPGELLGAAADLAPGLCGRGQHVGQFYGPGLLDPAAQVPTTLRLGHPRGGVHSIR